MPYKDFFGGTESMKDLIKEMRKFSLENKKLREAMPDVFKYRKGYHGGKTDCVSPLMENQQR